MTGAYDGLSTDDFADVLEVRVNNVEEFKKAYNDAIANALMEIGMTAEGYAKARCPVDTGRLRNSIVNVVRGTDVYVGTNVEYAPHVEFGARGRKGALMLTKAATGHADEYLGIVRENLANG